MDWAAGVVMVELQLNLDAATNPTPRCSAHLPVQVKVKATVPGRHEIRAPGNTRQTTNSDPHGQWSSPPGFQVARSRCANRNVRINTADTNRCSKSMFGHG
jgi:hypothetical protein